MAIFRTLIRSLLRNPNARSNPSFPRSTSPFPLAAFSFYPLSPAEAGAPNSFSGSGPLFLSWPPWKLSQSATPFYLRGTDAIFPKDLLRVRSLPAGLGLRSLGEVERGLADVIGLRGVGSVGRELRTVEVDEKFLNFPNLVSISRMVSGPLIAWMIIHEWYLPAFGALAVSGATDWLDGFLARKMGINSVFGSYLDPLADKVLISCVAVAMVKKDLLSTMLVALVVFRDVGLVGGAVYKRASSLGWKWKSWSEFVNLDAAHREKVEPLFISKVNTVFQLLLVAAALLQPEIGTNETQVYITYLSWLVASTTTASAIGYAVKHLRR